MICSKQELGWAFIGAGWAKGDASKVEDGDQELGDEAFLDAIFDLGLILVKPESVWVRANAHAVALVRPSGSDRVYPVHLQFPPPKNIPGALSQASAMNDHLRARAIEASGDENAEWDLAGMIAQVGDLTSGDNDGLDGEQA